MHIRFKVALLMSISSWSTMLRLVKEGKREELRIFFRDYTCYLCDENENEFYFEEGCVRGCPIGKRTGEFLCIGTPYTVARDSIIRYIIYEDNSSKRDAYEDVDGEIKFLRSFL